MEQPKYIVMVGDKINPTHSSLEEARKAARKRCEQEISKQFLVLKVVESYSTRQIIDCVAYEDE